MFEPIKISKELDQQIKERQRKLQKSYKWLRKYYDITSRDFHRMALYKVQQSFVLGKNGDEIITKMIRIKPTQRECAFSDGCHQQLGYPSRAIFAALKELWTEGYTFVGGLNIYGYSNPTFATWVAHDFGPVPNVVGLACWCQTQYNGARWDENGLNGKQVNVEII